MLDGYEYAKQNKWKPKNISKEKTTNPYWYNQDELGK